MKTKVKTWEVHFEVTHKKTGKKQDGIVYVEATTEWKAKAKALKKIGDFYPGWRVTIGETKQIKGAVII